VNIGRASATVAAQAVQRLAVRFRELADDAAPSEDELLRHCRGRLAAFKVPRKITFLSADELPKTSTGKVQKYLLVRDRAGS
jgi:fatty-acyl-CoA synthase